MDLFEKQDKIVEMYITREYTIPKLANETGMREEDVATILHLNNFYYGIKRNSDNMLNNKLYNFCISERKLESIRTL
ncbi:hypothetical protein CBE01nite_25570 [Clostridium beijerinckii]|uniref:Uncharacterized protein n=2 Tax=Clostridium TaxID=1485 RepID=A0A964RPZ8_9CLOT|nr:MULTISPECIES: hypothetical protein [Clostridium]MVX65716.1 hypothetical protein [Clostridium chromiireducens]NRZ29560.1 hypothetical protein [Clostridium beijerinckii]NYB99990.1 hypothetical protein [Clostridium beijerinckii]OOM22366.1 hypothetical protein CLBEI_32890 [Clostridium beijerinckii]QUN37939.1 hypothetical protein KEC93_26320 [Clostridium beijerinckii]